MKSVVAVTDEIGTQEAVSDLASQIKAGIVLKKNSFAVLYFDYEMDGAGICALLSEKLGIEVLGCSAVATLDNTIGYHGMSAMLGVFTAEDCSFSVAVTELTSQDARRELESLYTNANKKAMYDARLALVFFPYGTHVIMDLHMEAFTKFTGGIPVVGGVPSWGGGGIGGIVYNGVMYRNMAAMLLVGGKISPLTVVGNVIAEVSGHKQIVTESSDGVVYRVGGKTFLDYVKDFGIRLEQSSANYDRFFFRKYPILVKNNSDGGAETAKYVRLMDRINWEDESGVAFGCIPEGATIALAVIHKKDIVLTLERAVKKLMEEIELSGKEYSAILCISSDTRRSAICPYYNIEGKILRSLVPEKYNLFGFYSAGELCPTSVNMGWAENCLHNGAIVLCAI